MSDPFFKYSIKCPNCGFISYNADGFETDDWVEVFVFSGYSSKVQAMAIMAIPVPIVTQL